MIWIDQVPWWANVLVFMTEYQWYLLAGIIPTIYLVIVRLFGFPLLQRWSNEVVIMLYPTKATFGKITSQYDPYFGYKKGLYWLANPLSPVGDEPNQVHVFTHAVNQPVYAMERRNTKVDEILNNEHKVKQISRHTIWLMKKPKLHFHRHWQLIIDQTGVLYKLVPVPEKQQFNVGLYHTLGIILQKQVETETPIESGEEGSKLIHMAVTNNLVIQQMKYTQEYQNYSASHAYKICKRLSKIENNYIYWVSGSINPLLIIVLIGAIAAVGLTIFLSHGPSPESLGPMPGK